jgi:hypothetical protein
MKAVGVNQALSSPGPIGFVPDAVRKYYPILDFVPDAAERLRKDSKKAPGVSQGLFSS